MSEMNFFVRCCRFLFFAFLGILLSGNIFCKTDEDRSAVPIFSRAQLKYGLERTDYHNRWVDRPLFVNPALRDAPSGLSEAAFRRTQEIALQYGLRGLAFFPENYRGSEVVYDLTKKNKVPNFELLTDFDFSDDVERKVALAGMALANPASFRIDGKVVIVSYVADNRSPKFWEDVFRRIRETHGDYFIFLPALNRFAGETTTNWIPRFDAKSISPEQEEAVREGLRKWVRATDGLYFEGASVMMTRERTFHEAFYRDFIIRHMKEVLAEPEFAGKKYLGLSACIGHENCTRFGYTLSSDGTATLRRSLEAALDARPDVVVIPEWDEQNENTSLRPTVYNGRTAMRLLRHYTSQERGELQEPLSGDDTNIPNFILSYRKILVLGEKLKLELLHVPERGVNENKNLTARIELTDETGSVVWTSQELEIPPGKLWEHVETIPSEQFSRHRYLLPAVKVTDSTGERVFSEGFQAIDLRPTWNWDYKWVMQPLREVLIPTQCDFKVTSPQDDVTGLFSKITGWFGKSQKAKPENNLLEVSAQFAADEPLAYVEILDNDDVIYSHEVTDPMPRETAETAVFRLDWQSLDWRSNARPLKGSITLKNAKGRWIVSDKMKTEGQRIIFDGQASSIWVSRALLSVPKDQLDAAVLEIDLPNIWQGELSLRKVYDAEIHGLPGPVGLNFVISRFLRQDKMPHHLDAKTVSFTVPVKPDLPRSRLHLQAISASGKTYRSRPFIAGTSASHPEKITVFSDSAKRPMEIEADAARVPDIVYQFTPDKTGSVLRASAGRPFWGILGGYSTQATGRGGGESRDGTPFLKADDYPANITGTPPAGRDTIGNDVQSAPNWVKISPDIYALAFNGKSTFLTLPQGVIPRRASYEIRMELMPDHVKGQQILISNRGYYPGSLTVFLDEGTLKSRFLNENVIEKTVDSGLKIEAGRWSDLRVIYDQSTIVFQVNDQTSKPLPLQGPGIYDTVSVVGGYGKEWFAGKMKSLSIRHGRKENISNMNIYNVIEVPYGQKQELLSAILQEQRDMGSRDLAFLLTLEPEQSPYLEKLTERLACFEWLRDRLKEHGIRCGILVQSMLSHDERHQLRSPAPFQRMVNIDGSSFDAVFCPLDPGFQEHIRQGMIRLARAEPDFIMTDDDFRLVHSGLASKGCFCPLHLRLFNELSGNNFSREELIAKAAEDSAEGLKVRQEWNAAEEESLLQLAGVIRKALDEVNPRLRAGICVNPSLRRLNDRLSKLMAGGQRPFIRLAGACYMEQSAKRLPVKLDAVLHQRRYLPPETEILLEADTYPHNRFSVSAKTLGAYIEAAMLLGIDSTKSWVELVPAEPFGENPEFVDVYRTLRPKIDALQSFAKNIRWRGASCPTKDDEIYCLPWNEQTGKTFLESHWISVLGRLGFPHIPGGDDTAEVLCFDGQTVEGYSEAEWQEFFKRGVLLDGEAAERLCKMGLSRYLGVEVETDPQFYLGGERYAELPEWNGKYSGIIRGASYAQLGDIKRLHPVVANVHILGEYIGRPWRQSPDIETLAPSLILFENALGGRVAVYAGGLERLADSHFINPFRRKQLENVLRWLSPKEYPIHVHTSSDLYVLLGSVPGEEEYLIYTLNLNADPLPRLLFTGELEHLRHIEFLNSRGQWEEASWERDHEEVRVNVNLAYLESRLFRLR